ncbi:unnamed protein product [Timema podura]|uniref:Uncharacterized protein n=1 Tax=Timema podura TaxID=61482 RepID=A0ABN7P4C1_TIMPD|nr:unnamed protein product [Timema podura]
MARGTFANIRLVNKFIGKSGPKTIHIPSGQSLDVYDAAERYIKDNIHPHSFGGQGLRIRIL